MGYGLSPRALAAIASIFAAAWAGSCALNPQPAPPLTEHRDAAAGSAGSAGAGGFGGGDVGGSGGTLGSGGIGTGAHGGSAGTSGVPGDAAFGDDADAADTPGDAGTGLPPDFEHCATAPPSTCTPTDTCAALGDCGLVTSFLDANGCMRASCTADADCRTDERCLPTSLVTGCVPSTLVACAVGDSGQCGCSTSTGCGSRAHCVPETQAPREADCALGGLSCEELNERAAATRSQARSGLSAALDSAVDTCGRAIQAALRASSCPR